MLLRDLLAALPGSTIHGPADIEIGSIHYDSRQSEPGSLFVAVPSVGGSSTSGGYQHIDEAARRGAVAIVAEAPFSVDGVTAVEVTDARRALADLASAYYGHPSSQMRVHAVTGTDGKTTTCYLLEQVLAGAGRCTGLVTTVEIKIGAERYPNLERMTTPESLDLQRLLRRMADAGVTDVAIEASSHALALDRLRGCQLAATALTSITADHVEFHGSWEAYFQAKLRLFTKLAPVQPKVINRDDPHAERWLASVPPPVVTYGIGHDADVRATGLTPEGAGTAFVLQGGGERARVHLNLPGHHNVANALAATGLAMVAGVPLRDIAELLSHATPPPGRWQVVPGAPFDLVIDYAHTVNAFRTVLETMRARTAGRLIAVFGATGDRDRAKRPVLAQIAREYADFFIITNEDPYGERAESIIAEIAAGVPVDEAGRRYVCEIDRRRAIGAAISMAQPGDAVVILGKGHERSIVTGNRKEPWSDVDAAKQALAAAR